ncbi:MAG: M48 family metallopeptidase [Candidatus Omnitrophica bacterium]|nr:M48 family metallopeptidase [Candidatus Omnitrophota bacterium]
MSRRAFPRLLLLILLSGMLGCATTGPGVTRDELKASKEYYEVRAQRHIYRQYARVRAVGSRLLRALPEAERPKKDQPEAGLTLDDLDLTTGRVFGIPWIEPAQEKESGKRPAGAKKRGCLIVGILPDGPAAHAGLQEGDLLLRVGKKETPTARAGIEAFKDLKPGQTVSLLLEREGTPFERNLTAGTKPYPVSFDLADSEAVNAFASPGRIIVTSGLLRFVRSDDELAIVLSHELAHLTNGHYAKRMGTEVLAGVIGAAAGVAVDMAAPGAGRVISRITASGVRAPFSQDFEREADYKGLTYAHRAGFEIDAGVDFWDRFATELPRSLSQSFFSTHPSSPERLLRLEKTIEEIRSEKKG